jgi:hypothetical protein
MSVPYYLGAQAIAERLGYKDKKSVMRLAVQHGLPIFKRRKIISNGGFVVTYCISESAITAWELVQGQRMVNKLRARREHQQLNKAQAPRYQRVAVCV